MFEGVWIYNRKCCRKSPETTGKIRNVRSPFSNEEGLSAYMHYPEEIKGKSHADGRGEIYSLTGGTHNKGFRAEKELDLCFAHTKITTNQAGVFRGFHADDKTWKKITCVEGEIISVIINPENTEFKERRLNIVNKRIILIPPGWYNGFISLTNSIYLYSLAYKGKYNDADDQDTIKIQESCYGVKRASKWLENRKMIVSERDT